MKLKNIVTGVLTNNVTGEKRIAFKSTNHVQNEALKLLNVPLGTSNINSTIGNNIFISENNPKKNRRDWVYFGNGVTGVDIDGIPSPEYSYFNSDSSVHVKELAARFVAPATDRSISSIGVTRSTSPTIAVNQARIDTILHVNPPCLQTTTETLDVYYRIQVLYPEDWETIEPDANSKIVTPSESYHLAQLLFGVTDDTPIGTLGWVNPNFCSKFNPRWLNRAPNKVMGDGSTFTATDNVTGLLDDNYYRSGITYSMDLTVGIGSVISAQGFGINGSVYEKLMYFNKLSYGINGSPLQSVFGHSSAAVVPFYDSGTSESGLGTIGYNADSWTDPDWPKMLKVKINTTGAVGISNYQFQYRNFLGFDGNTYQNKLQPLLPFAFDNKHMLGGFNYFSDTDPIDYTQAVSERYQVKTIQKYSDTQIMAGSSNEIAVSNIFSGDTTVFDSTTTPALNATLITQFIKDSSNDIWVACRNTGLYRIDNGFATIDLNDDTVSGLTGVTGCYGVAEGASGRIWAYFDGTTPGMYYSDNSGTSWTNQAFSFPAIDADPNLVQHIFADPTHADNHIAVSYFSADITDAKEISIAWWDGAAIIAVGGAAVAGPLVITVSDYAVGVFNNYQAYSGRWANTDKPVTYFNHMSCSPNDSFWFTCSLRESRTLRSQPAAKLTFGSATVTEIGATDIDASNPYQLGWGIDETGADAAFYITDQDEQDNRWTDGNDSVVMMVRNDLTYEAERFVKPSGDYTRVSLGTSMQTYMGNGVWIGLNTYDSSSNETTDNGRPFLYALCGIPDMEDIGNYENEMYPTYGWNGVSWEKYHSGSKLTHLTQDTLIDGVTVSFDDNSGSNSFSINDYYVTWLVDGILLDGSTTYEQEIDVYLKPTLISTDMEVSTLTAATRIPNILLENIPDVGDWVDGDVLIDQPVPGEVHTTSTDVANSWKCIRSSLPVINSTTSNMLSAVHFPHYDLNNIQGYIECKADPYSTDTQVSQAIFGLSGIGVIGTTVDISTIEFGIGYSTDGARVGDLTDVYVIESGTIVATETDWNIRTVTYGEQDRFRIIILNDGTVIYEGHSLTHGWVELYKSSTGHAAIKDYYMDIALAGYNNTGLQYIKSFAYAPASNYFYLGNGADTGTYHPDFVSVDPKYCVITINGSEAVNIGDNDTTTVLASGTYSLFPDAGVIRVSAIDAAAGYSIEANYLYLTEI